MTSNFKASFAERSDQPAWQTKANKPLIISVGTSSLNISFLYSLYEIV